MDSFESELQFQKQNLSQTLSQLQPESTDLDEKIGYSDPNQFRKYFIEFELKILKKLISQTLGEHNSQNFCFEEKWNDFSQIIIQYHMDCERKFQSTYLKVLNFIYEFNFNNIDIENIYQEIGQWQNMRMTPTQMSQVFNNYDLQYLIQEPKIINVILKIVYNNRDLNQYDFYDIVIQEVIKKDLNRKQSKKANDAVQNIEEIYEALEQYAINLIFTYNSSFLEEDMLSQYPRIQTLLQQKQIVDFLIARYFDKWLTKISVYQADDIQNETDIFIAIRDQSKIKKIDFIENKFERTLKYLQIKYFQRESDKIRLIKMVKASAFINNFEQEAGNAMYILSSLQLVIRNENFTKINLVNSSMNNIKFLFCNFNESKISNVSIVSAQFIECQLQNVQWKNLESSFLSIIRGSQTIFSANDSVLISTIEAYKQKKIYHISFINLHTGKKLKVLNKQFKKQPNQKIQLSCQGYVLLLRSEDKYIFWSTQSNKKIRVNLRKKQCCKLSNDGQSLVQYNYGSKEANIWSIYKIQQNLKIQVSSIYDIKFSNNDKFLIADEKLCFWDALNGKKIETIQQDAWKYQFLPDGQHYAIIGEFQDSLSLRRIDDEKFALLIKTCKKNESVSKLKFSSDGKIIAFLHDKQILLWTIKDQNILSTQDLNDMISFLKFTPDGQKLVFNQGKDIVFWNFTQGKQFHILKGFSQIKKINFSHNGLYLLSQDIQNCSFLWNLKNQQKYINLSFNEIPLTPDNVFFSSSTTQLCFVYGRKFQIKNLSDMRVIHEVKFVNESKKITSYAISPDFKTIANCCTNSVYVQNIENQRGSEQKNFKLQNYSKMGNYQNMKFSPDGEYLMVLSSTLVPPPPPPPRVQMLPYDHCNKQSLEIIKISNQEIIFQEDFTVPSEPNITKYEFSQNGRFITVPYMSQFSSGEGEMRNKLTVKRLEDQNDVWFENNSIFAFSLNQQFLAFSNQGEEDKIIIWNINKEKIAKKLKGHVNRVTKIIFLNQKTMISASLDGKLIIWNFITGEQLQVLDQNGFGIKNLSISHDKSMMISMDNFGSLYLWSKTVDNFSKFQNSTSILDETENNQNANQYQYHYSSSQIFENPKFRTYNCQISGSKFYSTERFNLHNIFIKNTGLDSQETQEGKKVQDSESQEDQESYGSQEGEEDQGSQEEQEWQEVQGSQEDIESQENQESQESQESQKSQGEQVGQENQQSQEDQEIQEGQVGQEQCQEDYDNQ